MWPKTVSHFSSFSFEQNVQRRFEEIVNNVTRKMMILIIEIKYFWKFKKLKYFSVPSNTGFSAVVCIPLSTNDQICRANSRPFVRSYPEIGNTYFAVQLCSCLNTWLIHLFMHTASSNTKDTSVFIRSGSKTNSNWINNQFTMCYIWDIVNDSCNNKFS